jgi:hypothetical protein
MTADKRPEVQIRTGEAVIAARLAEALDDIADLIAAEKS